MATHDPTFCDITWGAGGTTADLTLEIASKMQNMVCMYVCVVCHGKSCRLSCAACNRRVFWILTKFVR